MDAFNNIGLNVYHNDLEIPDTRSIKLNIEHFVEGEYFIVIKGKTINGVYKFIKVK